MIKALLVDVLTGNKVERVEVDPDSLDDLYKLLVCDCIDIVTRTLNGKAFDIVCDDEGLYRDPYLVSAVGKNGFPMLVGNLLFVHHDGMGGLTGLSDEDIKDIMGNIGMVFPTGNVAVFNLDY